MKLLVLLALVMAVGCTKKRDSGARDLYLVSPEKFFGYDPIQSSDQYSGNEIGKIYESLYEFHPLKRPYELLPNLAESLPTVSDDGLTYTIKLKKGVRFHDDVAFGGPGREVKAQDLVYSLKRIADPKNTAKAWWLLEEKLKGVNEWRLKHQKTKVTDYAEEIEGLKALDDYTIQFVLTKQSPQFLYALAMPQTGVVAREVVEKYGEQFLNHPVGTGPFTLKEFKQSNEVIYTKNPNYREKFYPSEGEPGDKEKGLLEDAGKRIPLVDRIIVNIQVEAQPTWQSFQRAKSDLIILPKDNFQEVIQKDGNPDPKLTQKGIVVHADPMIDVTYIAFNNELPIFKNNKKLRQAMSVGYNRPEANKLFYNSTAMIAQSVIPPALGGFDENYKNPFVEYNLARAKILLKEAGYENGKGLPEFTLQTISNTANRQIAEHFAKNMMDLGIKIKVNMNTWPELTNKVARRQAQLYAMAWGADYPDAENFLGLLYCPNKSPGSNGSNYCNPKFDELFQKARMLQDSPERNQLYAELNAIAGEEVPWIFSFNRTRFHLAHAWVKNFKYIEFSHFSFQYLNVDNEVKKEKVKQFQ